MNLFRIFSNSNRSPLTRTFRFGLLAAVCSICRLAGATDDVAQTVIVGSRVTFSVTSAGNPSPTFQWKKNGVNLSGQTSNTLVLNSATLADAATYTVEATNSAGMAVSNNAVLQVSSSATLPAFAT